MHSRPRRGRPPAEHAPASLTDILSAALRMFADRGFEATSVAALNRELGVSHNLIHQRFGSKEGLWYATVDWAFGDIADHIDLDTTLAERDLMAAVRATLVQFLEVHARHPHLIRLVTIEAAIAGPRLTYLYEAHVQPLYARLTAPLKSLVDKGVLSTADVRSLHFLLAHGATAPLGAVPLAKLLDPADPQDPTAVRRHAEFVADVLVAGLLARGAGEHS
jgi:TetR/AcrR family transcriptional regulator